MFRICVRIRILNADLDASSSKMRLRYCKPIKKGKNKQISYCSATVQADE
jgi:hypothetical protein